MTRITLPRTTWCPLAEAHQTRADALTRDHRERTARGETHPVFDFLFTYYPYRPSALRRWHPGAGVALADAADSPQATWKWYRTARGAPNRTDPGTTGRTSRSTANPTDASAADRTAHTPANGTVSLDTAALVAARGRTFTFIRDLLQRTASRAGNFGCFGLHEWAMVYRTPETRHEVPLRLGREATDAVVDSHPIACTHFDAFRFFTPEAVPLNRVQPTRESQAALEQPACLHAGMDLYKWVTKLGPAVPGELLLDAFELARDIRILDMRASPYDVSAWGFTPVAIETDRGKDEYARQQRGFAGRADVLRQRTITAINATLAEPPEPAPASSARPGSAPEPRQPEPACIPR